MEHCEKQYRKSGSWEIGIVMCEMCMQVEQGRDEREWS